MRTRKAPLTTCGLIYAKSLLAREVVTIHSVSIIDDLYPAQSLPVFGIDGDVEAIRIEASVSVQVVRLLIVHEQLTAVGAVWKVEEDGSINAVRLEVLTGAVDDFEGGAVFVLLDRRVRGGLNNSLTRLVPA